MMISCRVSKRRAFKHTEPIEAGLGASKPLAKWIGEARAFGARFANPFRSLAGGEKAVFARLFGTALQLEPDFRVDRVQRHSSMTNSTK